MIDHILQFTVPAAYALLPPKMQSPRATAMLLAIGFQESRFTERRQIGGPARGFWQFEAGGGVKGVLEHPSTADVIADVLEQLEYSTTVSPAGVTLRHLAIEHNDTLAFCFARCLLWTVPGALPGPGEADLGWVQYIAGWRPGRPHRATWDAFYAEAWMLVNERTGTE